MIIRMINVQTDDAGPWLLWSSVTSVLSQVGPWLSEISPQATRN